LFNKPHHRRIAHHKIQSVLICNTKVVDPVQCLKENFFTVPGTGHPGHGKWRRKTDAVASYLERTVKIVAAGIACKLVGGQIEADGRLPVVVKGIEIPSGGQNIIHDPVPIQLRGVNHCLICLSCLF